MIAVQFADCGSVAETADFNTFFKTTCEPGAYSDEDSTFGNAPMIEVLKPNGENYDYYYYIRDAYDETTKEFTATAWVTSAGDNLTAADFQTLSKGFWFKSMTAGTVNCAGQVSKLSSFTRNIPGGQFEIVANPYPTALNLNTPTTAGFMPGAYSDEDSTFGNAPMIEVLKPNGENYDYYYYIRDAYDETTKEFTATAWVTSAGDNLEGTQVGVGQAFWIKSATAGTFTFELK